MDSISHKLAQLGLSDKEAKVYVALLSLGMSEASKVAKKAGLNRSTTYVIIDSLTKQGLVSSSRRGSIQLFVAAEPEKLTQIAEAEMRRYADLVRVGKELAITLKDLSMGGDVSKPKIEVREGAEALKSLYQEILSVKGTVRVSVPFETQEGSFFDYVASQDKSGKSPSLRVLCSSQTSSEYGTPEILHHAHELFVMDGAKTDAEMFLYDSKVTFVSPSAQSASVIENQSIYAMLQAVFEGAAAKARKIALKQVGRDAEKRATSPAKEGSSPREKSLVKAQKRFFA